MNTSWFPKNHNIARYLFLPKYDGKCSTLTKSSDSMVCNLSKVMSNAVQVDSIQHNINQKELQMLAPQTTTKSSCCFPRRSDARRLDMLSWAIASMFVESFRNETRSGWTRSWQKKKSKSNNAARHNRSQIEAFWRAGEAHRQHKSSGGAKACNRYLYLRCRVESGTVDSLSEMA